MANGLVAVAFGVATVLLIVGIATWHQKEVRAGRQEPGVVVPMALAGVGTVFLVGFMAIAMALVA